MLDQHPSWEAPPALVTQSLLYRQSQAQRQAILLHKWYESEKAGHDIGMDKATADWIMRHRRQWLRWWRQEGHHR